ncbi:MAG TPA: ATP-binding protein [Candidatus Paceibacterota bacterium]
MLNPLSTPHEHKAKSSEEIRQNAYAAQTRLIYLFIFIGISFGIILIIQRYLLEERVMAYIAIGFVVSLLADLIYLNIYKKNEIASTILLASFASFIVTFFIYGAGNIFLWLPVFGAVAFFLKGTHMGFIISMTLYIIISILVLLDGLGKISIPFIKESIEIAPDFLSSVIVLFLFMYLFHETMERNEKVIKEYSEEIEDKIEKERLILNSMETGLITLNDKNIVDSINAYGANLLKINPDQGLGKNINDIIKFKKDGYDVAPEKNPIEFAKKKEGVTKIRLSDKFELTSAISQKTFPIGMNITYPPENHDVKMIIVFFDLTQDKKIEQLKDAFLSSMQHQITTPIATIRWGLELLREDFKNLETSGLTKEYIVDQVSHAVDRITQTQENIMTVARIEHGFFPRIYKPLDIKKITDKVLEYVEASTQKTWVNINKVYDDNLQNIKSEETILFVILQNIISNAIKYNKVGGEIFINIVQSENDEILIKVKDQGIGIPKEAQSKIFEKFFRTANAKSSMTEGTGLGLYITKILVSHIGGKIWFESEEGKGTTFFITIPNNPPPEESGE